MDLGLLFDPLFRVPLMAGLLVSVTLPLLGALLRLRNEWLAALGLAHLAAAAGLGGLAFGIPVVVGAPLGAALGAVLKSLAGARGNTAYAVMILLGWSATFLVAANTALGSALGHALVDGQVYFADSSHLVGASLLGVAVLVLFPWLSKRLIRSRFYPQHDAANQLPAWHWHLSFDLLAALGMALGTATVGLMGAFALVFIPPWIAFRAASGWRSTLVVSLLVGVAAYLGAFVAAMLLDQPFGPMLVAVLLAAGAVFTIARPGIARRLPETRTAVGDGTLADDGQPARVNAGPIPRSTPSRTTGQAGDRVL